MRTSWFSVTRNCPEEILFSIKQSAVACWLDSGPGQRLDRRPRPAANNLAARLGVHLGDTGPDVVNEMVHTVDIGNVGEMTEEDHSAAVRRRVRGAWLIVFDVLGIGNDRRTPGS